MLVRGTRVLIKTCMQMGMTGTAYLFSDIQGRHLVVDEPSINNPGCYVLCPAEELDGEEDKYRVWNERRKRHVTVPECCFIVDPVISKSKRLSNAKQDAQTDLEFVALVQKLSQKQKSAIVELTKIMGWDNENNRY